LIIGCIRQASMNYSLLALCPQTRGGVSSKTPILRAHHTGPIATLLQRGGYTHAGQINT